MCKGSQTTSSQSSTSPNPQAAALYQQILGQAQGVAQTPYQAYTGQLTAPVNAQQTAGISNINANAGFASPYISQAAGLAQGAANPLTTSQIQQYQNPYIQNVVDATQAQFNDQNARQDAALRGNQISSGALGGNRTGITRAVQSGQQQLAQDPVIANLYAQSYNSGLGTAAQQFQQNPLAAAGSIANFGISGQNAALQGAGQQINAGTLQQQTQQAADTANYGQFQQQQAYPFQTAQWLANIGTGVGQQLGTTTSGTTTAPPPNPLAQYAGLGISAAGLFLNRGGAVHRDGGGGVGGFPYGVSPMPYAGVHGYVPESTMQAHALQSVPFVQAAKDTSSQDASNTLKQVQGFMQKWNATPDGQTTMGSPGVSSPIMTYGAAGDYAVPTFVARGGAVHGYADGGIPTMDERFAPVVDAIQSGDFDPQGVNATNFKGTPGMAVANSGAVPLPMARPTNAPTAPVVAADGEDEIPAKATPTEGIGAPATPYARDDSNAGFATPAPAATPEHHFGLGLLSPNAKTALLTAGLGMLASRSPFLGVAAGEGGLAGLNAYGAANAADAKAKQDALKQQMDERRVQREADALAETIRHNKAGEAKEFKPSWGVVGEWVDPDTGMNRKTYGWIDPNKKAITDASGKPITQSTSPTPDKPAPVLDADGKPITGEAALSSMSPQRAAIAKQIGDYKVNPNSLSVRGGHREQAIADATKYNPDYDQRIFSGSNRAMSNFMGGPEGRTIRSLNVAIDHLGTLDEAAKALKNSDYPALNKWINVARQQTGSPVTTNFDSIKQVVSAEIAKAVVGGQTALHDRDDMAQRASAAQSPEQIAGIITEFKKLMAGQMKGLRKQYEVSTRAKNFDDYLEPSTKKELSKFDTVKENYETSGAVEPPKGAVDLLRSNPALATQFNSKYGAGAAERYLGAP